MSSSLLARRGFFASNSRRLQQLPDSFPACNVFLALPVIPGFGPRSLATLVILRD